MSNQRGLSAVCCVPPVSQCHLLCIIPLPSWVSPALINLNHSVVSKAIWPARLLIAQTGLQAAFLLDVHSSHAYYSPPSLKWEAGISILAQIPQTLKSLTLSLGCRSRIWKIVN